MRIILDWSVLKTKVPLELAETENYKREDTRTMHHSMLDMLVPLVLDSPGLASMAAPFDSG